MSSQFSSPTRCRPESTKQSYLHLQLLCNQRQSMRLLLAIVLWYSLGVICIATSKILLSPAWVDSVHGEKTQLSALPLHPTNSSNPHELLLQRAYFEHVGGIPPLLLTLQQLALGTTFLRILLAMKCFNAVRLQPLSSLFGYRVDTRAVARNQGGMSSIVGTPSCFSETITSNDDNGGTLELRTLRLDEISSDGIPLPVQQLTLAGLCFTLGFLATNVAFSGSNAAFVETVKAAEPITSACVAVAWGIERLNGIEISSLATLVAGVLLSTYGNTLVPAPLGATAPTLTSSILSCMTVMMANLCFSFRGLYQKLFRLTMVAAIKASKDASTVKSMSSSRTIRTIQLDDINLQYRMQQLGVCILFLPTAILNVPGVLRHLHGVALATGFKTATGTICLRYGFLAVVNGLAFTSYKYVSISILGQLSTVRGWSTFSIKNLKVGLLPIYPLPSLTRKSVHGRESLGLAWRQLTFCPESASFITQL